MPGGKVARNLARVLTDLYVGQSRSAVDAAGQVLVDVWYAVGGLTTAGSNLAPNTAGYGLYLAVGNGLATFSAGMSALAHESARVPIAALAGSGATAAVVGVLDAAAWNGWAYEMGLFGGAATAVLGSGTLLAYGTPWPPILLKTAQKQVVIQWSAQTGVA